MASSDELILHTMFGVPLHISAAIATTNDSNLTVSTTFLVQLHTANVTIVGNARLHAVATSLATIDSATVTAALGIEAASFDHTIDDFLHCSSYNVAAIEPDEVGKLL